MAAASSHLFFTNKLRNYREGELTRERCKREAPERTEPRSTGQTSHRSWEDEAAEGKGETDGRGWRRERKEGDLAQGKASPAIPAREPPATHLRGWNAGAAQAAVGGTGNGNADPSSDMALDHRVGDTGFVSDLMRKMLKHDLGLTTEETIGRDHERAEVTALLATRRRVLPFLPKLVAFEDLGRFSRAIGRGVSVGDTDVKDGIVAGMPEATNEHITAVLGSSRTDGSTDVDGGFSTNSVRREDSTGEISDFRFDLIMACQDKSTFLAGKSMRDRKLLATTITFGLEIVGCAAIAKINTVVICSERQLWSTSGQ